MTGAHRFPLSQEIISSVSIHLILSSVTEAQDFYLLFTSASLWIELQWFFLNWNWTLILGTAIFPEDKYAPILLIQRVHASKRKYWKSHVLLNLSLNEWYLVPWLEASILSKHAKSRVSLENHLHKLDPWCLAYWRQRVLCPAVIYENSQRGIWLET